VEVLYKLLVFKIKFKKNLEGNDVKKLKTDYVTVVGHMTKSKVHPRTASHKSNPSSLPRGIVDSYSTLGHVGGRTVVEGIA
jgi:hypothetical protein